jgi:hypothetical protein
MNSDGHYYGYLFQNSEGGRDKLFQVGVGAKARRMGGRGMIHCNNMVWGGSGIHGKQERCDGAKN